MQGDLELTQKCVEAMNAKSDPSEEDKPSPLLVSAACLPVATPAYNGRSGNTGTVDDRNPA